MRGTLSVHPVKVPVKVRAPTECPLKPFGGNDRRASSNSHRALRPVRANYVDVVDERREGIRVFRLTAAWRRECDGYDYRDSNDCKRTPAVPAQS